jgi:hypothetical protein
MVMGACQHRQEIACLIWCLGRLTGVRDSRLLVSGSTGAVHRLPLPDRLWSGPGWLLVCQQEVGGMLFIPQAVCEQHPEQQQGTTCGYQQQQ